MTRVDVRRVVPDEWQTLREIRLAALADALDAYLTTLAEAQAYPDELWRDRIVDNPHLIATVDGVSV